MDTMFCSSCQEAHGWIAPQYLKIQMPYMPYPHGRTISLSSSGRDVLFEVSPLEPMRYRKAIEKIAYFFKRELGYDFPPYHTNHAYGDRRDVVFMWVGVDHIGIPILRRDGDTEWIDGGAIKKAVAYGACGFLPRTNHENEDSWELAWVWLHPYERKRGHLSNAWPYFLERFGLFSVGTPWSVGMQGFLRKHEYNMPEIKEIG